MSREQTSRRVRIVIAIVPVIAFVLLNHLFDWLHDMSYSNLDRTRRTIDRLSDWIAGPQMSHRR